MNWSNTAESDTSSGNVRIGGEVAHFKDTSTAWLSPFHVLLCLGLAATYVAWTLSSLSWPMGRDQGILAWIGWGIAQGKLPYRDLWDVKGPGSFFPFALSVKVFGHNMWGIRAFDDILQLVGIGSVAYCAKRLGDSRTAIIAAALMMLLYMNQGWWETSQPDGWAGILLAVALAAIAAGAAPVSLGRTVLFGLCVGLCTTIKPLYIIVLLMLLPRLSISLRPRAAALRSAFAACIGCAIPMVIVAFWFAARGGIRDLYGVLFEFNGKVHMSLAHLSVFGHLTRLMGLISTPFICTCLATTLWGGYQLYKWNKRACLTLLIWIGCVAFCIVLQGKYFWYQIGAILPALSILSAVGVRSLDGASDQSRKSSRLLPSTLVAACMTLVLAWPVISYFHDLLRFRAGVASSREYAESFQGISKSDYWYPTMQSVSNYVRDRTRPLDTVENWGWDPLINFLSERNSPTRFGYDYPLQIANPFEEEYRAEFMQQIRNHPPVYVLVPDKDDNGSGLMRQTSLNSFRAFTAFHDFVTQNYQLETQIDEYRIWRRKNTLNASR